MKTKLLNEHSPTLNPTVPVGVSRKTVRERAVALAEIDGRTGPDVGKSDWEQAKRELAEEPATDTREAMLEAADQSARWDLLPDLPGHRVAVAFGDDEDGEGRSDRERMVMEGVAGAEDDHLRQSAWE